MELIIIILLLVINGLLSMAEIAMVASKKTKIQQLADKGNKQAVMVLNMLKEPNMLFSTIQVGITLIGVLNGAFGAIIFAEPLSGLFDAIGLQEKVSDNIAFFIVVGIITYISIIIGELVPKRLGLHAPEKISLFMAQPMMILSRLFGPGVRILSDATDMILSLFQLSPKTEAEMSIDEVRAVIKQGAQSGVFKSTEKNIVEKTLNLSELRVTSIMTARNNITWVDIDSNIEILKQAVLKNQFSFYPVCKDSLDNVKGIINADALLGAFIADKKIDIHDLMYKPLLIPEHVKALQVLELFKKNYIHMGIVIDEYGNVQGLVTVTDILEAIVGDFPTAQEATQEKEIIQRNTNSWLLDGLLSTSEFKHYFKIESLPFEKEGGFNTIGGFVMHRLGRVPISSDSFELNGYRFEVVDMDGNRVDKLMLTKI